MYRWTWVVVSSGNVRPPRCRAGAGVAAGWTEAARERGGPSMTRQVMGTYLRGRCPGGGATRSVRAVTATPTPTRSTFGPLLRQWRTRRRLSQLDLAIESDVSARHISFLETGRSKPSREM